MSVCKKCDRYNNLLLSKDSGDEVTFCTVDENGKHHSYDDKPGKIFHHTSLTWYKHGIVHRDGGPAYISKRDKIREWYSDGILHREDGPAYINGALQPEPFQRYVWIWHDEPIETYDEELLVGQVIQYRDSWGDLKPFKTAVVLERVNEFFWKILVGDKQVLIAGIKDYDKEKDKLTFD